jgi:hypothetical protein
METMELKMNGFSNLDMNEAMEIDGGGLGQALALTGGSVALANGALAIVAGVATGGIGLVVAGLEAAVIGGIIIDSHR